MLLMIQRENGVCDDVVASAAGYVVERCDSRGEKYMMVVERDGRCSRES